MVQPKLPVTFPIKMGILLGVLYCLFIFIENKVFSNDTILFAASKTLGFIIILAGFFYTAFTVKKNEGGYITFQECLRALLVVIAVTELFYVIFNLVYVKYIDPNFFNHLKESTRAFLEKANLPKEDIANRMKAFEGSGNVTFWSIVQSYGFAIIIDAIFAVVIASILKKNPPITESQIIN